LFRFGSSSGGRGRVVEETVLSVHFVTVLSTELVRKCKLIDSYEYGGAGLIKGQFNSD
jgi:hypothetical protein